RGPRRARHPRDDHRAGIRGDAHEPRDLLSEAAGRVGGACGAHHPARPRSRGAPDRVSAPALLGHPGEPPRSAAMDGSGDGIGGRRRLRILRNRLRIDTADAMDLSAAFAVAGAAWWAATWAIRIASYVAAFVEPRRRERQATRRDQPPVSIIIPVRRLEADAA